MSTNTTTRVRTANVGLIGCGNISRRYVEGIARFPGLKITACADLIPAAALQLAAETGFTAYDTIEELLADTGIDIVVNITPPTAHAEVTITALKAGKHVYVEKPMAATLTDATRMIEVARQTGLSLGCAPDTFLGSAGQTARSAIDDGAIGTPIGAVAFITHSRLERWHPNPTLFFKPGGGPLLDLGPYYISTLVNLLGPIESVSGSTRVGATPRTVTAPNRVVDSIDVEVTTHASATLNFVNGAIGTLVASFDIWESHLPKIEIYGTLGGITVPDPNQYDGTVTLRRNDDSDWTPIPPVLPTSGEPDTDVQMLRGLGVADLLQSLNDGPLRVHPELAAHVLEVLEAVEASNTTGNRIAITSRPARPAARTA